MGNTSSLLSAELDSFAQAHQLTPREQDVVYLLLRGTSTVQQIAEALTLSQNTIHNHFKSIFRRTKTNSKAGLLALFIAQNIAHHAQVLPFVRRPQLLLIDVDDSGRDGVTTLASAMKRRGMLVTTEPDAGRVTRADLQEIDAIVAQARSGPTGEQLTERLLGDNNGERPTFLIGDADSTTRARWAEQGVVHVFSRVAPSDEIVFAVLEQVTESPYDHNRLIRVETDIEAQVDRQYRAGIDNLSFGGAFLHLPEAEFQTASPRVGRRIHLEFSLDGHTGLGVEGEIRWTRNRSRPAKPSGMGIQFLDVDEQQRDSLRTFVRRQKLASLGPWDSPPPRPAIVGLA